MGKNHALVCLVQKGEKKVLSTEQNDQDDDDYDDQLEEDFEQKILKRMKMIMTIRFKKNKIA